MATWSHLVASWSYDDYFRCGACCFACLVCHHTIGSDQGPIRSRIIHCNCPSGFALVRDGECRGKYTQINAYWDEATKKAIDNCKQIHGQPVIIHNDEHQSYWLNRMDKSVGWLLLGLSCNTASKKWEWPDGSAVDYKPAGGNYDSDLNSACKTGYAWQLNPDGRWHLSNIHKSYTIDIYCTTQLQVPVPNSDGCDNFEEDNEDDVCYQIGTAAENWHDAQLICKQLGANLASIHSDNENSFIRRLAVSKGAVHGVFLGATISGKGGSFGWIDGSAWDYDNYYPGFPKSGFGDCIALDTSTSAGLWMNMDCTAKLPVACVRAEGTQVAVNPACSSDTWKAGEIITSPGFPYNASVPCEYYLVADEGKKVELEIALLEANTCCESLEVYDGYFGGYILANLTGEVHNKTYKTTQSNIMKVIWKTQGGVNVRGMAMSFRAV